MNNNDDICWQEIIKNITPLKTDKIHHVYHKVTLTVKPKINPCNLLFKNNLDNLQMDSMINIDASTAKKFKRGLFPIEAELDLHGFTEKEAFSAVIEFIQKSYLQKKRCIAVITGKGLHQTQQDNIFSHQGILKNCVPQWLNLPDIRPLILAIKHPENKQGGSGIIHILLRRQR